MEGKWSELKLEIEKNEIRERVKENNGREWRRK